NDAVVVLTQSGVVMGRANTDARGFASFWGIAPGRYEASIEHVLVSPFANFNVSEDEEAGSEVWLLWPRAETKARNLRGRFGRVGKKRVVPLQYAMLELLNREDGTYIMLTTTDGDGHFSFPWIDPGVYVIRVTLPANKDDSPAEYYDTLVELNPE